MDVCKKNFYKNQKSPQRPSIVMDWKRRRILEIHKARCREKIDFHTKKVVLQSLISLMCVSGGIYAGQKRSIVVPLILAPMLTASCSNLAKHEAKRHHYKEVLEGLERS